MKPRLHRSPPAVQRYGHLSLAEAVVIAQHYHGSLLRLQAPQGIANSSPEFGLFGRLFRRGIGRSKDVGRPLWVPAGSRDAVIRPGCGGPRFGGATEGRDAEGRTA